MPDQSTTLTPYLCCRNAADAVAFYEKAFGAETRGVHKMPDGRILHAALDIGGASVFLCDEFPEYGGLGPQSLWGTAVTLHLQVPDCGAVYQRAVADMAGAHA